MLPIGEGDQEKFENALDKRSAADADYLFWGTYGWLAWIEQQQGSPAAMADLVTVEKIMARLLELDDTVEQGGPHLFFREVIMANDFKQNLGYGAIFINQYKDQQAAGAPSSLSFVTI